jgi:bacterioferritin
MKSAATGLGYRWAELGLFRVLGIAIMRRKPEVMGSDLASEVANQGCVKTAIGVCEDKRDYVSREILENILDDTEEHIDWIETQQNLIEQTTLENYLQEQMYKGDS